MISLLYLGGHEADATPLAGAIGATQRGAIRVPGSAAGYDALARQPLRAFVGKVLPKWKPGGRLVIFAYSAAGWALRRWLHDPQARDDLTVAVFVDAIYPAQDESASCDTEGIRAFGLLANLAPLARRLVVGSVLGTAPDACAEALRADLDGRRPHPRRPGEAPEGNGCHVRTFASNHITMRTDGALELAGGVGGWFKAIDNPTPAITGAAAELAAWWSASLLGRR